MNDQNNTVVDDLPDMTEAERNGGEIPWNLPDIGTAEEETKKRAWIPYAPNIYLVGCEDVKMVLREGYMTKEKEPQLEWKFQVVKTLDGSPVQNNEGKPLKTASFTLWSSPFAMATSKKDGKFQKTRAIMTALLGLPANAALPQTLTKPENFIGQSMRVVCEVVEKPGKSPQNVWSGFAPYKVTQA